MAARRSILKAGLGIGIQWSLAAQTDPDSLRAQPGDVLVRVDDADARPLAPADIPAGKKPVMAWPMEPAAKIVRSGSRLNRLLLLRLPPEEISAATKPRAADGVVAFTAICTHTGCEVTERDPESRLIECPCHASKFEPRDGAKVVGGPAPRSLPALPLKLVEGRLVVAGPFNTPVGFERG